MTELNDCSALPDSRSCIFITVIFGCFLFVCLFVCFIAPGFIPAAQPTPSRWRPVRLGFLLARPTSAAGDLDIAPGAAAESAARVTAAAASQRLRP